MISILLLIGSIALFGKVLGLSFRIIAFLISLVFEISFAIFLLMIFGLVGIVCFLILEYAFIKLLLV